MIRRRRGNPLSHPCANLRRRQIQLPHRAKEPRNMLIQNLLRRSRGLRIRAHIHPAPRSVLRPALPLQLPVPRAHRVRMNGKSPRQLPRARQLVSRAQISTQNRQHRLRHQLAVNRHFAARRKPKSQGNPPRYCDILVEFRLDEGYGLQPVRRLCRNCGLQPLRETRASTSSTASGRQSPHNRENPLGNDAVGPVEKLFQVSLRLSAIGFSLAENPVLGWQ